MSEAETKPKKPISSTDLAFVNEYFLHHMNNTRAYLVLHPKSSYNAARANSARLIAKDSVKAEIAQRIAEKTASADEALMLISDIERGDIGDLLDNNGLLDIRQAKEKGLTRLLRKIKQKTITHIGKTEMDGDTEITEIEFEMYSSHEAAKDILKVNGKFTERVALQNPDGSALQLAPETMKPSEIAARVVALMQATKKDGTND